MIDRIERKKIIVISLSAVLVFVTLIAGLFLAKQKKNKESRENNDIGEVVNENDKNIENNNNDNEKETDDLPWLFGWTGAVIDLIISFFITAKFKKIIFARCPSIKNLKVCFNCILSLLLSTFIFSFFCFVVFPSIFAIQKYKNKSYWERLKLIEKNFFGKILKIVKIYKTFIAIFFILFIIVIIALANANIPQAPSQANSKDN